MKKVILVLVMSLLMGCSSLQLRLGTPTLHHQTLSNFNYISSPFSRFNPDYRWGYSRFVMDQNYYWYTDFYANRYDMWFYTGGNHYYWNRYYNRYNWNSWYYTPYRNYTPHIRYTRGRRSTTNPTTTRTTRTNRTNRALPTRTTRTRRVNTNTRRSTTPIRRVIPTQRRTTPTRTTNNKRKINSTNKN